MKKKNRKAGSKKVHIKLENHSANGKLAFILYKGKTFGVRELPRGDEETRWQQRIAVAVNGPPRLAVRRGRGGKRAGRGAKRADD